MHLPSTTVLRAMGRIVEQTNNLDILTVVVGKPARVMLEAEVCAVAVLEVALLAVQTVDDLARGAVDLVDGASVAGGDEVVPLAVLVDAVDVEVVPCVAAVVA
jgi:hypothetical protein